MPLDDFSYRNIVDHIDIQQTTVEPVLRDRGNKETQGRTISKTIQLGLFTNNAAAYKAGHLYLRKLAFPFATVTFPANRKVFRLEVGDLFLFSFSKYSISQRVYRVESIEEDSPESEKITITATEEIFSRTNQSVMNESITSKAVAAPDYSLDPFTYVKVVEAPYVMSTSIQVLPLASKQNDLDLGFALYISNDGGSSYNFIKYVSSNIVPYGTLVGNYTDGTYTIDLDGFVVNMISNADTVETTTFPNAQSGVRWVALLGNEIITFQEFTPISGTQYQIGIVFRGRYGTTKQSPVNGEAFWVIPNSVILISDSSIVTGANLNFKLIPYNSKRVGSISDATAQALSIIGRPLIPYIPVNFQANGNTSRYTTDVVLTWSARKRGEGAGIGIPGTVLSTTGYEGLFEIEVWVNDVLVRTTSSIAAVTWTYTQAMNITDNGSLAANVTFKLSNYQTEGGITYESDQAEISCLKV